MTDADWEYPVALDVEYPDRELDRLTTLLRPLVAVPIVIILSLVSGPALRSEARHLHPAAGGIPFAATVLMLLFRQKYPRWWYDWNLELSRFTARVAAYLALLRDEYPSSDMEQAVHLDLPYPDARRDLNRWLPIVKWLLALPHWLLLAPLCVAAVAAVLVAWFTILVTGRYPRALFDFVVGVMRWWVRVVAYAILLVTDRYPPFRLAP